MVKCGVFFEVRTELLNNIYTSSGFKGSVIVWYIQQGTQVGICVCVNELRGVQNINLYIKARGPT
jgi:hypothetical protein